MKKYFTIVATHEDAFGQLLNDAAKDGYELHSWHVEGIGETAHDPEEANFYAVMEIEL